ncbi:ABC-2 family transporter protein [Ruminiclostridium hungatei]|uniref:ABC-2 family transporter protein n=2 Tax=Ruminiclostridium hungatei TaxID=48256 RepID=A0A1V4SMV8_RUMHU|nr:ABC-2 family transporter protein [Ruminiclostridium hungatei]
MNGFMKVLKYTYKSQTTSKSFIITTLIFILIIVGMMFLPSVIENLSANDKQDICLVDETGILSDNLDGLKNEFAESFNWNVASKDDMDRLIGRIHDDSIYGILAVTGGKDGLPEAEFITKRVTDDKHIKALHDYLQVRWSSAVLNKLQLSDEQKNLLTSRAGFKVEQLGKSFEDTYLLSYILMMILFMSILMYGSSVAGGVGYEKSNRVMEILITSVKPTQLLLGKTIGLGLAGLTQFFSYIIAGCGFYMLFKPKNATLGDLTFNISNINGLILVYLVIFFLLGYFFYATIYAGFGSIVSKNEDLPVVTMPLAMVLLICFFITMYTMTSPDGSIAVIFSIVPFSSPITMFTRILTTDVPLYQILLSIFVLIASIGIFGWLAARIYKVGVLLYGNMPKLKDLVLLVKNDQ